MSDNFNRKEELKSIGKMKISFYVIDIFTIMNEKAYNMIFNTRNFKTIEAITDYIDTENSLIDWYIDYSFNCKDNLIIMVPNEIISSGYKMFKLQRILDAIPINYNSILSQYQIDDLKISTINEYFKVTHISGDKKNPSCVKIVKL